MMSIFRGGSWKGPITRPSLLSASPIMALSGWAMMAGWWNSMMEQPLWAHGASQKPPGPSRTTAARPGGRAGQNGVAPDHLRWLEGRTELVSQEPLFPKWAPITIIILITAAHQTQSFTSKWRFCTYQDGVAAVWQKVLRFQSTK